MVVTIDIGNTSISVGIFAPLEKTIIKKFRKEGVINHSGLRASTKYHVRDNFFTVFKNQRRGSFFEIPSDTYRYGDITSLLRKERVTHIHTCFICSVVPPLNIHLKKEIRTLYHCPVSIIGKDVHLRISHRYKKIRSLGNDRLVNIYGALLLYRTPFVVIDFGTAITFDYVNKKGIFEGGLIVPGIETSFHALMNKACLLPKKVTLVKPRTFLGRIAHEGMVSGTVYGFASLTDRLIDIFKTRYGRNIKIIATGGKASFIRLYCKNKIFLDTHLTLKSLYIIASTQKI